MIAIFLNQIPDNLKETISYLKCQIRTKGNIAAHLRMAQAEGPLVEVRENRPMSILRRLSYP